MTVRLGAPLPTVLLALAALLVLVVLPLLAVFAEVVAQGIDRGLATFHDPESVAAIRLTLLIAAITVPVNTIGGLAASWCIARFSFPGRGVLLTFIELPLSVSPVISGLVWVLLFGARGWFGPALEGTGFSIVFATPGLVLATLFVTFPFVVRQVVPLMQAQGSGEEEAALTLGAGPWRMFWHVTLPNVRWALLQGVLLTNARAMGEFGAVAVVSGRIRGQTLTMPLQIEALYNDFQGAAAFAMAALLALLALVTLAAKTVLEWRTGRGASRAVETAA
ncbi:sulfate/thiosulfate ABC transporter inner membrane subunit CysW [Rhodovastum atsumiense]|uniref:Sulfate ABC transporter permease subunit CysW n=1 Tax=Rhodovastum atsumiense TaxID=504468 RepID=A0A5M6IK36_9PROT|nr:sulfate ABC transporter permease subunit CysW [Rhodovastum atsumiense]KAA5608542.1 sulfate ABC transporter permease subunit CysW [Rhodovastum atsumiense]CAH2599986.1 sulfate/thiosulfate ABC transporter inner membrane subunit CysW [Rhodovastum atsumiense]